MEREACDKEPQNAKYCYKFTAIRLIPRESQRCKEESLQGGHPCHPMINESILLRNHRPNRILVACDVRVFIHWRSSLPRVRTSAANYFFTTAVSYSIRIRLVSKEKTWRVHNSINRARMPVEPLPAPLRRSSVPSRSYPPRPPSCPRGSV